LIKEDPIWSTFDAGSRTDWRTIKMNRKLAFPTNDVSTTKVASLRRITQINNPDATPLLFDGTVEKTKSDAYKTRHDGWEVHVELRHHRGANILFVDGHVQLWQAGKQKDNDVGWKDDTTGLNWYGR